MSRFGKQRLLLRPIKAQGFQRGQVANHNCQGFVGSAFSLAEKGNSRRRTTVCRKMKTAHAPNGDNLASSQQRGGVGKRIGGVYEFAGARMQADGWPTDRASVWLSVKSSVSRIVILPFTIAAKIKHPHRGFGSIVGDLLNDGKARTTIGTVNKRIMKAPIIRVKQFSKTVIAEGDIRRYCSARRTPGSTRQYGKWFGR